MWIFLLVSPDFKCLPESVLDLRCHCNANLELVTWKCLGPNHDVGWCIHDSVESASRTDTARTQYLLCLIGQLHYVEICTADDCFLMDIKTLSSRGLLHSQVSHLSHFWHLYIVRRILPNGPIKHSKLNVWTLLRGDSANLAQILLVSWLYLPRWSSG